MNKKCKISEHLIRFFSNIPDLLRKHIENCSDCQEELKVIELMASQKISDLEAFEEETEQIDDNLFGAFLEGKLKGEEFDKIKKQILKSPFSLRIALEYIKENSPEAQSVEELLAEIQEDSPINIKNILEKVKDLAKDFISQFYPKDLPLFDASWVSIYNNLTNLIPSTVKTSQPSDKPKSKEDFDIIIAKSILIITETLIENKDAISDKEKIKKTILKYAEEQDIDTQLKDSLLLYFEKNPMS